MLPPLGVGLAPVPVGLPMVILAPPPVDIAARTVPEPASVPQAGVRAPAQVAEKVQERVPEGPMGRKALPESFRAGYPEYLRSARMGEVAGVAAPGIAGILILTAAGGLVGYRQAKAGLAVRAAGTARFLQKG
jgi:hypothetical protein